MIASASLTPCLAENQNRRLHHGIWEHSLPDSPPDIGGIIATCLTPFNPDGRVDFDALRREINYIVDDCRADAIAIGATEDAEYTMLDWAQRKELIARGAEMVARRIPLVVGISHPSPQRVIELAITREPSERTLSRCCCRYRLWGGDPTPGESLDYVARIAGASPLPVSVYQIGRPAPMPRFRCSCASPSCRTCHASSKPPEI